MDSEDEVQGQTPVSEGKKKGVKVKPEPETIILSAPPRKKKVPTQSQIDALHANRAKALEKLTEMRRKKKEEKEEVKKIAEEVKLDRAPKVREIDGSVAALRAEMEALKKELAEAKKKPEPEPKPKPEPVEKPVRKVKKIVYEDEDEEAEEIVEVVRRKTQPKQKAITGTELLDKLFFNQ